MRAGSYVWAVIFWLAAVCAQAACQADQVELRGPWGQAQFSIEIADTADSRALGLMHRADMPRRHGMLFVYETPQRVAFWMKNTLIPLDMIFVESDGVISHIHENAIPGDLTSIPGGDQVLVVLELNAGLVRDLGITVGSQMRHKVFSQERAIWPC
ncbi:DUF192 domain-containing protein [Tritonibacter horizontis]|uniref:ACR n=1 Tax=Tritonibacter horizontis TaxID=1768241 RepID=A0A132BSZ9_9RHOB|nr:DUF192 domain-containing protein [Tritonibacter horizontis]KUP90917.1 hypothetical protein TRIHO_42730 [Tritonibacter horizontis]